MQSHKFLSTECISADLRWANLRKKCADYTGAEYAIACSSGTDALVLALMAYDVTYGDYVITTPFTFIATAEAIALVGARPVFVDIDPDTYNISPSKLEEFLKTTDIPAEKLRGVITVDLYGQCADYDNIREVMKGHDLFLIQDAAQSFGASYKGAQACAQGGYSYYVILPCKAFRLLRRWRYGLYERRRA